MHELELTNALSLVRFRKEASEEQVIAAMGLIQSNLASRVLVAPAATWQIPFPFAAQLAMTHSPKIGSRSLDILTELLIGFAFSSLPHPPHRKAGVDGVRSFRTRPAGGTARRRSGSLRSGALSRVAGTAMAASRSGAGLAAVMGKMLTLFKLPGR